MSQTLKFDTKTFFDPGHCNSLNSSKLCSGLQESCPEASGGQCVLISSCPTADDCNCTTKFRCSGAKESPNSSGNLFEPERLRTVEVDSIEDCNAGECPEFKDECPSRSGKCRLDHQCDNGAPATAGGEGEEVKCKCLVHFACALKNAPEKVMDDIEAESFRRKRST